MSRAWMPFYVGDYLRDTMHLTPAEHGMYILLILHYWENGKLPDTPQGRATICRVNPLTWKRHEGTISEFFLQPGWRHKRIDSELAKFEKVKQKRRIAGSKGGTVTYINRHLRPANAAANAVRPRAANAAANALPTTLSKNILPSESESVAPHEGVADKKNGGGLVSPELVSINRRRWGDG